MHSRRKRNPQRLEKAAGRARNCRHMYPILSTEEQDKNRHGSSCGATVQLSTIGMAQKKHTSRFRCEIAGQAKSLTATPNCPIPGHSKCSIESGRGVFEVAMCGIFGVTVREPNPLRRPSRSNIEVGSSSEMTCCATTKILWSTTDRSGVCLLAGHPSPRGSIC